MQTVNCKLILDRRKVRKWVISSVSEDVKGTVRIGLTVSIGGMYVDKVIYNIGDEIMLDATGLKPIGNSYYTYNKPILTEKPVTEHISSNPISLEHDGFFLSEENYRILNRNIEKKINTLILGPTGSGKTETIQILCEKLGIPCSVYDMGGLQDPISGLLGVHRLEKGESIFDYAKFVLDVQKPGVIVLDELSRSPHSSLNILFPCLDSRRMLPVEIASSRGLRNIPVHPDCCFIATANIGVEYTGTLTMDKALLNRFFVVEMSYLTKEIEATLLQKRLGISKAASDKIATMVSDIRRLYKDGKLNQCASTRESLMVGALVNDGWNILEAFNMALLPLFVHEERNVITKLVMSK